jgi:hypothetical protein
MLNAAEPVGADYVFISTNDTAYESAMMDDGSVEFVCAVRCSSPD